MPEQVNGARKEFGRVQSDKKAPGGIFGSIVKELLVPIHYDDLPGVDANDETIKSIPANSLIVDSYLHVETAFAGGTNYNIGLSQPDGTVIDADGLDAAVLLAALTAGAWIVNDGALVGATIGAAEGQVTVTATGTFTAGKGYLLIRYIEALSYS